MTSGQIVGRSKHRNSKSQSKRAKSKENAIPTIIGHYSSTQQQSNGFQNYTVSSIYLSILGLRIKKT